MQFSCACGASIGAAVDTPDTPVQCEQCGRVYLTTPEAELFKPLIETTVAKIATWGCAFPIGILLLSFGTSRWIWDKSNAISLLICGFAVLTGMIMILRRQRASRRTRILACTAVLALIATVGWLAKAEHDRQLLLDAKFAGVLSRARDAVKQSQFKPDRPRSKYLPVVFTEIGSERRSSTPHVLMELYSALPPELRAENQNEVRTLVCLNWWFESSGTYRTMDGMRTLTCRIFRGGCTLKLIDTESKLLLHRHDFVMPDGAPETTPGGGSDWYGPQPPVRAVLEYLSKPLPESD